MHPRGGHLSVPSCIGKFKFFNIPVRMPFIPFGIIRCDLWMDDFCERTVFIIHFRRSSLVSLRRDFYRNYHVFPISLLISESFLARWCSHSWWKGCVVVVIFVIPSTPLRSSSSSSSSSELCILPIYETTSFFFSNYYYTRREFCLFFV